MRSVSAGIVFAKDFRLPNARQSRGSLFHLVRPSLSALSSEVHSAPAESHSTVQIHFVLLISRQGKVRLAKWYSPYTQKERTKVPPGVTGRLPGLVFDHKMASVPCLSEMFDAPAGPPGTNLRD